MDLAPLIGFYQTLTPASVSRFGEFYAEDAWFKDPFNDVRGLPAIENVFRHMFTQVDEPRFVVSESIADAGGVMLVWDFHFRPRLIGWRGMQRMQGVSHLRFDAAGKVCQHRDYWDTGEELYMKLPLMGGLWRVLRRLASA